MGCMACQPRLFYHGMWSRHYIDRNDYMSQMSIPLTKICGTTFYCMLVSPHAIYTNPNWPWISRPAPNVLHMQWQKCRAWGPCSSPQFIHRGTSMTYQPPQLTTKTAWADKCWLTVWWTMQHYAARLYPNVWVSFATSWGVDPSSRSDSRFISRCLVGKVPWYLCLNG